METFSKMDCMIMLRTISQGKCFQFWLRIPKEKQKIRGKPAAALWTRCWTACSSTDSERLYSTGRQTAWACSVYSLGARDGWWVQLQKDILPQMSSRGRSVMYLQLKRWQLLLPTYIWLWRQYQKWGLSKHHLTIPEPFHNAEYGQEMCSHNLLFQFTIPQD